ncbi:hypothetical protein BV898_02337 [Hypsibius exemplaris]|uniref:Uncharacterized protein n=1 Tax=Hypsibius exemplaris TaxID=2072580 RepID=A0A1W0X9Q3_HYPEX|nr:hypothetical protein BV898_02337 [Hypsibius exemplaris]
MVVVDGSESSPSLRLPCRRMTRTPQELEPKEFPMGVRVRGHDFNTVTVDWRGIMTGPQEEPIEGYKLRYWRQSEHVKEAKNLTLPLEFLDGNLHTLLGGLTPGESKRPKI